MKKYLGVKIVEAEPMTNLDFQEKIKNSKLLPGVPFLNGYKVVYEDGYVSWSPKEVFEKAYKEIINQPIVAHLSLNSNTGDWIFEKSPSLKEFYEDFDFGTAIKWLKIGKKVSRAGWNGKGMWLKYIGGIFNNMGSNDYGDVILFDDSLPKEVFIKPWIGIMIPDDEDGNLIPWSASQTDMLAEDWQIVK